MSAGIFVTGTDTDVGKTAFSAACLRYLALRGYRALGLKPIASGFDGHGVDKSNADIDALTQASGVVAPARLINRYAYDEPIAPHIAASRAQQRFDLDAIAEDFAGAQSLADFVLVEGVGGWMVPLSVLGSSQPQFIADLAQRLRIPVVLVVGLRLGCLNHALLTARAILQSGLPLLGWVANHLSPQMAYKEENIQSLQDWMPAPMLCQLPYQAEVLNKGDISHINGALFDSLFSM